MTSNAAKHRAAQLRARTQSAGAAGQGSTEVAGGLAGGETWVWNMGTTGTDYMTTVKYINSDYTMSKADHTIRPPRCKIYKEWRDSTKRGEDEEPDICEYVVKAEPGPGWMEWSVHLTWERWCHYVSPDGDVETALSSLRSLARGEYRLQKMVAPRTKSKYNQGIGNCLMFTTVEAARRVADVFTKAVGDEVMGA